MSTIFGNKVIQTVSYDQDEILKDIISLYAPDGFECDITYSRGLFYRTIKKPRLKFDILPQAKDVVKASAEKLPLKDGSVKSLVFDPPFICSWNIKSYQHKISKRFTVIRGIKKLREFYDKAMVEINRVIDGGGVVIVKCQDTVYAGKQYYNHIYFFELAEKLGMIAEDLFILIARSRWLSNPKQKHARKYHAYFWVFRKIK